MYCPNCGKELPEGARFCPDCGFSSNGFGSGGNVDPNTAIMFNKKSEGLALILSLLIPGLGHMYAGKVTKGLWILIGAIVCAVLFPYVIFTAIGVLALWVYGMYDAYITTKEYNEYLISHSGQRPW